MAPKVTFVLPNRTAHVPDPTRSIPPEFDAHGGLVQGHVATREVPPWEPFEVEAEEAERLIRICDGIKVPVSVADAPEWLLARADDLKIPRSARERLASISPTPETRRHGP